MQHRHLTTQHWSAATVDSALERGGLEDWRELFTAVRADSALAEMVLRVARQHAPSGSSILATALVERLRPGFSELRAPQLQKIGGNMLNDSSVGHGHVEKATPPQPGGDLAADLEFASANQQLEGFPGKITPEIAAHRPNMDEIAASARRFGAQIPTEENRQKPPLFPLRSK